MTTTFPTESPKRSVLIAGCGYLGQAAARLFLRAGWSVFGCTQGSVSAAELARNEGFPVFACDLTNEEQVAQYPEWRALDVVVHCASSGRGGAERYQEVYLRGAQNLTTVLRPGRLIFTSSTSVYAQTDGAWVDEQSAADPDRETGKILRATEDFVLENGGMSARVAGIYGPGRSVLLRKFLDRSAVLEGDGSKWVNQAHRDDIASALVQLATSAAVGIFNVADDHPQTQREIYTKLAAHFQRPLPPSGPIDPQRKRGWTSKRVSNLKLRALGWAPRFPSFFDAVENDPGLATTPASADGL